MNILILGVNEKDFLRAKSVLKENRVKVIGSVEGIRYKDHLIIVPLKMNRLLGQTLYREFKPKVIKLCGSEDYGLPYMCEVWNVKVAINIIDSL